MGNRVTGCQRFTRERLFAGETPSIHTVDRSFVSLVTPERWTLKTREGVRSNGSITGIHEIGRDDEIDDDSSVAGIPWVSHQIGGMERNQLEDSIDPSTPDMMNSNNTDSKLVNDILFSSARDIDGR